MYRILLGRYARCLCFYFAGGKSGLTARNSDKNGKDILLIFTGSDWSQDAQDFQKYFNRIMQNGAGKNYTALFIDLLHNPSENEREAAQKLSAVCRICGTGSSFYRITDCGTRYVCSGCYRSGYKTEAQLMEKLRH